MHALTHTHAHTYMHTLTVLVEKEAVEGVTDGTDGLVFLVNDFNRKRLRGGIAESGSCCPLRTCISCFCV